MTLQETLALAADLAARGEPHALVTVVRVVAPTSAHVGAQAIVLADGSLHGWIGGGCAKGVVIAAAQATLATGLPKLVRISNEAVADEAGVEQHAMLCASNGTIELFIQPVTVQPGLCVLGATPAAAEARFQAEHLGIRVCDTPERAPIVLVATQGEGDEAALESALASGAGHVLMIASRRKAERLRAAMRLRGFSAQQVEAIESPVGPDIGASTPAEIALAAVAEVVRLRRLRAGALPAAAAALAPPPGAYVNPVCGAAIRPEMVIHTREHDGLAQYFCCDHCMTEFERDPARYTAIARRQLVLQG